MSAAPTTIQGMLDELAYSNYRRHRTNSPSTPVEHWAAKYGPAVWKMEERYQAEQGCGAGEER